jgi:hypothetical protein
MSVAIPADDHYKVDTSQAVAEPNDAKLQRDESMEIVARNGPRQDAPAFLVRAFGSKIQKPTGRSCRRSNVFASVDARIQQLLSIWRRHLEHDAPNAKTERRTGVVGAGVFALLSLLIIIICAGAAIALTQIKSLKSEVASLQRELSPLKERLATLDQAEKAKEAQDRAVAEKAKASTAIRTEQAPLSFSREEIQLIRDYIKPAPFTGTVAPPIKVGDPLIGGTIALPSPLTDKVPKLVGARFAIHNGTIIIVKRDSRQADAVLPSY